MFGGMGSPLLGQGCSGSTPSKHMYMMGLIIGVMAAERARKKKLFCMEIWFSPGTDKGVYL